MKVSRYSKGTNTPPPPPRGRITLPRVVIASAVLLMVFAVGTEVGTSLRGSETATSPASPIENTLFTAEGTAISTEPLKVAGVEVAEPVVNVGVQPLNIGVAHEFKLRNTSSTPVILGRANIEVLEGCCPSDPILSATRIEPGEEVPLLFSLPMGMHQGMDGPHLFRVTVPVRNESGDTGNVEVYVKADFRAGGNGASGHDHAAS